MGLLMLLALALESGRTPQTLLIWGSAQVCSCVPLAYEIVYMPDYVKEIPAIPK